MKKLLAVLALVLTLNFAFAGEEENKQLEIGDKATNTSQVLKDVTGYEIQLKTLVGEHGLLVLFSCNTCPFVLAWEDRYNDIAAYCEANNIGFVVVNSNEAKREGADSYEAMKKKAKDLDYKFYYAVDWDHELADAFGATKTPDVFLFDKDLKLAYKGAIDDSKEIEDVEAEYLNEALKNLVAGVKIDPNTTKAIGCTIKRKN